MKSRIRLICIMCIFPIVCFGQQKWEEYVTQMAEEMENSSDLENLYDDLSYVSQYPYNLNAITVEQLKIFPFLSETQANKLMEYIKRHGPMQTIYELRLIPEFNKETIDLLIPFVYVGKREKVSSGFKLKDVYQYGKNELSIRYDRCLNEKAGYKSVPDKETTQNYLGEPFYHAIKYNFRYKNNLQLGFTAEKDAGEMFRKKQHKGYDFYSGYFLLKNVGCLNALAIGNYRLNFGQGLILNADFSLGKSVSTTTVNKQLQGIKPHTSANEYNYFQGIAGSFQLNKIKTTAFYSIKKMDANVDTISNTILSIKKDGLHRTENDLNKKNTAQIQAMGGSANLSLDNFSIGVNFVHYRFDKSFSPEEKPYNLFHFRGKENSTVSIDYQFKYKNASFFGETAMSSNNAFATLNGLQLNIESFCRFALLHRYFDKEYHSFFANAFSESSSIQNEHGLYMGIELQPFSKFRFNLYADFFRFPWLKYGVNAPSKGFEGFFQTTYTFNRNMEMFLRYKFKNKEINTPSKFLDEEHFYPITDVYTHRLRYQFNCQIHSSLRSKTVIDYCRYTLDGISDRNNGFLLSQELVYQYPKKDIELALQATYFNTDDYDSRMYMYERNVLYAFSTPAFYGDGFRSVLNLRYHINKHISCWFRFSRTRYFDREVIGSGLEAIEGKSKNDISCLFRWKF